MRIGIGLPAAVPGADMTKLGEWAAASERAGFDAVGVIDRLVYDNVEPLVALTAAAARTERIELLTTVLNIGWRRNPLLLAKQLASVEQVSGGRLTAGLGLGGWPADYTASQAPETGRAALWKSSLATMRDAWAGRISAAGGTLQVLPEGRPALLFGGLVPAAWRRAATEGEGWVSPLFGLPMLREGATGVRKAWAEAGRLGQPRIVTGRYFSLGRRPDIRAGGGAAAGGAEADAVAAEYLRHYYGAEYFSVALADTLTTTEHLRAELTALRDAGTTDVVLYPASSGPEQVELLANALSEAGFPIGARAAPGGSGGF